MKTSVIPAQITTIEDKIAANLNLTQIVLLLIALLVGTMIFAVFPTPMKITYYKIPIIMISSLFFMVLALRVRGKVLIEWLVVLLKYNLRPAYYLYNKNDTFLREIIINSEPKVKKAVEVEQMVQVQPERKEINFADLAAFEQLLKRSNFTINVDFTKKGGVHVTASEIQG